MLDSSEPFYSEQYSVHSMSNKKSSSGPSRVNDQTAQWNQTLYKATGRVWSIEDLKKGNDGREEASREKIRAALQLLISQERRVTVRQLMRISGCSYHTVKRHFDIWRIYAMQCL
jgi:hypothetical protein